MDYFKSPKLTLANHKSESCGRPAKPCRSMLFHAEATDPDMLYFSRFQAPDPYLAFSVDGKRIGVSHSMEYGRMVKESAFDEILLLNEVQEGAAKRFKLPKGKVPALHQMVLHLAELHHIPNFRVGPRFPIGLARKLREAGMTLEIADDEGLFPERQIKTAAEVAALRKGNKASEAGFHIVAKTLAESGIRNGKLVHDGRILTSERLRDLICHAALDAGGVALHTIAAPGDQAVDNHCVGHGPIHADELIVVDIYPRRIEDSYWGDMTRTYLKGRANDAQRRLVRTVRKAHKLAISMIKPGMTVQVDFPELPAQHFAATVLGTSNAISEASRTSTVELMMDNKDGTLFSGSYAEVHFALTSPSNVFRLPVSALLFRKDGLEVATVAADNRVVLKPITLARDLGREVEVASGISRSDRVIDSPSDSIAQGDVVRIKDADTQSDDVKPVAAQ